MMRSRHINVSIDLDRVRGSAEQIRAAAGVRLISVIKSDAYGLGAARVADAIAAVSDDFAYTGLPTCFLSNVNLRGAITATKRRMMRWRR